MADHKYKQPKYDYDSPEWYTAITRLAMQGATDSEIPYLLSEEIGIQLTPEMFLLMIEGNYDGWTEEENKIRSEKLSYVLSRSRNKINSIVRGRFLKTALGGVITKNVTKRRMQIDGVLTDNEIIQTVEIELPPNMNALTQWMYHHDPEWRKIERRQDDENADNIPEGNNGVDIGAWIAKENEEKKPEEKKPEEGIGV